MSNPRFDVDCVLLDIEGTTSSIKFVYEVLFPFARDNVSEYLKQSWTTEATRDAVQAMAVDLGYLHSEEWFEEQPDSNNSTRQQEIVVHQVNKLMDDDIKATGLKKLQGLIWDVGYKSGTLRSHVYKDVPVAFKAWKDAGKDLRIYSSGSAHAQKVFFANTEYGALTEYLSAFYDTGMGAKRESASYIAIANDIRNSPETILFLSDVPQELDAAKSAGMKVCLVYRPGNASSEYSPIVKDFSQLKIDGVSS